jgi:hypothetical protein
MPGAAAGLGGGGAVVLGGDDRGLDAEPAAQLRRDLVERLLFEKPMSTRVTLPSGPIRKAVGTLSGS